MTAAPSIAKYLCEFLFGHAGLIGAIAQPEIQWKKLPLRNSNVCSTSGDMALETIRGCLSKP
jgi:hypothetical protein